MTATRADSCAGAEGGERAAKVGALRCSGGSVHRGARAGFALGLFLVTACRALLDYEPAPARVQDGGSGGATLGGAATPGGGGAAGSEGPGGATGDPLDAATESHEHDEMQATSPADGGLMPPPPNPDCTDYCDTVQERCIGPSTIYVPDSAECSSLCPHFVRTGGDDGINTLQCRIRQANLAEAASEKEANCNAASRMGEIGDEHTCGTACEAYCQLMSSVCSGKFAERFANAEACLTECGLLYNNGNFHAGKCDDGGDELDGASVQCRMWHVGAAAIALSQLDLVERDRHCKHASGEELCIGERVITGRCSPERAVEPLFARP